MKKLFYVFLALLLILMLLPGCGQVVPETTESTDAPVVTTALTTAATISQEIYDDVEAEIKAKFEIFDYCEVTHDNNQFTVRLRSDDLSQVADLILRIWDNDLQSSWDNLRDSLLKANHFLLGYAEALGIENPSITTILLKGSNGIESIMEICNDQITYDMMDTRSDLPEITTPEIDAKTSAPQDATKSVMTTSQKNATKRAKSYLSFSAFSHDGLIAQLEYEKFSKEDATFAADNCGADWSEQALRSAKNYIDFSAYSYSGLIDQLEYEKYTTEQATYGADHCGADWNEQAAKKAKAYLDLMPYSRKGLIDQLIFEGFTKEQAAYGAKENGL